MPVYGEFHSTIHVQTSRVTTREVLQFAVITHLSSREYTSPRGVFTLRNLRALVRSGRFIAVRLQVRHPHRESSFQHREISRFATQKLGIARHKRTGMNPPCY
jgi:hypothetical protein